MNNGMGWGCGLYTLILFLLFMLFCSLLIHIGTQL